MASFTLTPARCPKASDDYDALAFVIQVWTAAPIAWQAYPGQCRKAPGLLAPGREGGGGVGYPFVTQSGRYRQSLDHASSTV